MSVPTPFLEVIQRLLDNVSPYVRWLWHAASTIPLDVPLIIKLQNTSVVAGELAAVVHVANIQELQPRSILIHRSGPFSTQISILSPQYKPLQYLLLFSHGTPGWCPPSMNSHLFTQINWYQFPENEIRLDL